MKVLIINGPNINFLGIREVSLYGNVTYSELEKLLYAWGEELNLDIEVYQSNHEGNLIDKIQEAYNKVDYIVINPGGLTHYSVSLLDALKSVNIKTIEVHITDIDSREEFRKKSLISLYASMVIKGKGILGYKEALQALKEGKV